MVSAEESAAATKETIQLNVREQFLSLQAAEKNIQTTSKAVEQAEEDYKIAQVRYTVTVFGEDPTASELADILGTIPYEILTSIPRRIDREIIR